MDISKTLASYKDYDAGKHVQAISTPKTSESVRKIELTDEAFYWLKEIKRRQIECGIETDYIVATRTGKVANQRDLNMRIKTFCKAVGLEYKPTHTCRRTYASVLYDGGVPVSEIARDLGHKKITTTLNSYYKPRASKNITSQKNSIFLTTLDNTRKVAETRIN